MIAAPAYSPHFIDALEELTGRDTGDVTIWYFDPMLVSPTQEVIPGVPRMLAAPPLAEYLGMELALFTLSGNAGKRIVELFPDMRVGKPAGA
ncbi:MAG TPA: hypothetical protein VGL53_09940 [Bryobacteraceae bacterium]